MGTGEERGCLIEKRERLKVKLAEEVFYYQHIPQKRQMAIIGIAANIAIIIAVILFIWLIMVKSLFGGVVGPVMGVLLIGWIVISSKEWVADIRFLVKNDRNMELARSLERQRKLKQEIESIEETLKAMPVNQWIS